MVLYSSRALGSFMAARAAAKMCAACDLSACIGGRHGEFSALYETLHRTCVVQNGFTAENPPCIVEESIVSTVAP